MAELREDNLAELVESMTDLEFAAFFGDMLRRIDQDPVRYFIRESMLCDFKPTPAQTVALKTVFGQALDPTTQFLVWEESVDDQGGFRLRERFFTEVELYEAMTDSEYVEELARARNRINMIIGRRGGKTTISAMLALYCAVRTNWKPYLTKTPAATVAILSHTKELSEEILEIIRGLVEESPVLRRLQDPTKKDTQTTFNLKVPFAEPGKDGKPKLVWSRVQIKVGAASKRTIRGRAICAMLCDEIAFWNLDENAKERDDDILRAARPSLLQFKDKSLLIKLSSPGIKQGVLYNEWLKRHEMPDSYVTFKAPSWVWNTILDEAAFKEEYEVDPQGFATEFRADFVDSISNFILPEFVDLCTVRGVTFLPPDDRKGAEVTYSAAIDAAFKGDRFAFTLLGQDGKTGKVKQYVIHTWEGSRKAPVKAHDVAQFIRNVCKQYRIARVHADQYAFQPLREIFAEYGITLEENPFSNQYKRKIYFNLKKLVHNQQIDLLDHEIQRNEVKQLQVEQTATGMVRIGHPPGGKDDCADCTAIAAFKLAELAGTGLSDVGEIAGSAQTDYGIQVDATGKAFVAPAPEMLTQYFGEGIVDNRHLYIKDPVTGEIRRRTEDDDLDDGGDGGSEGADFVF